jgi:hypothetical protein
LRENFDRFNLDFHKEKEMVSFRRIILAIAVLALFTGLASAQVIIGPSTGSSAGPLSCTANVANPTQVRSEGYAELLGDIVISCTGGTAPIAGQPVPTANITVALNNTLVTSRIFSSSTGASEALLLIDEPGSPTPTGSVPSVGTASPQTQCGSATLGAGSGGCPLVVGTATNATAGANSPAIAGVAVGTSTTTTPINVFQGLVRGNQVIFNGVPILAPVTGGFARVFRITNIRGNAAQFAGQSGNFQGQTPILASVSISNGLAVTNSLLTTAYLYNGLGTTVVRQGVDPTKGSTPNSVGLLQCGTSGLSAAAILRFPEGFAAAFKTRVTPTSTYSGAATTPGGAGLGSGSAYTQNIPGQFSPGSESGFILPITGGSSIAGLADFGTRLKATFNNVPTGVNIFVSTTNLNPNGNINTPANTPNNSTSSVAGNLPVGPLTGANNLIAALVLSETATSGPGGFVPLATNSNNNGGVLTFGPLPVDANGTATAVWEILSANPNAFDSPEFGVYISYTGNPATNVPPVNPAGTVALSFAPTFSTPTASSLIPRFTPASTSSTIISVVRCQTTLLYPFVSSEPGFDTGIAIANTTQDPFGTRTQSGTCTLNFFGSSGTNPASFTTPVIGPNATDNANKALWAAQLSGMPAGASTTGGFRGYIIAVCDFQLAHGYALFSDTGIRNWATGYLALVIPTGTGTRNSTDILQGPGVSGGGVEGTGH